MMQQLLFENIFDHIEGRSLMRAEPPEPMPPSEIALAKKWAAKMAGIFTDPLVVPKSPWSEDIPEWLRGEVTIERFIQMKTDPDVEMGTDAEAVVYLLPLSQEAPLTGDFYEIYMYACTKVLRRAGREVPPECAVERLDDYRMGLLNHLKHDIYRSRLKARKGRK